MYKMKEVCAETGLTEKTIRFYVEQNLVQPQIQPGLHYKSYSFSDADVQRLRDIAALRSASFSLTDIRAMLDNPNVIPERVARKEAQLGDRIAELQAARAALQSLTVQEQTDFGRVADAIEPRSAERKETPKNVHNRLLWLTVYAALFLFMGLIVTGGKQPWLVLPALLFLAGLWFPGMSIGYFRYYLRGRKLPCYGEARIVSVISDEGISEYWPPSDWTTMLGMLNVGFLHWDWIRPDHWVPLIQFELDGRTVTTAYRYGWLKRSWQPGKLLKIAWQPEKELQVYPVKDRMILRKAWVYFVSGILSMAVFVVTVCHWLGGLG